MLLPISMLLLGVLLWFGVAYTRYGNAQVVDELRSAYKKLQQQQQDATLHLEEYIEQNKILKHNAQLLLDQNEDYMKIISQLSRYYYHIRQASEKTKELQDILRIHDDDMDKKISLLLPPTTFSASAEKAMTSTFESAPLTKTFF